MRPLRRHALRRPGLGGGVLKVLHVISSLDKTDGGTVTALLGMAASQAEAGLGVSVLSTQREAAGETVREELEGAGVRVNLLLGASPRLRQHAELRPQLRSLATEFDVFHVHAVWEQPQHEACRIAAAAGVPYIVSPHGMLDPWSLSQSRFKKALYLALRMRTNLRRAAAIHFTTTTERDLAQRFWRKGQALVEPLGVDLETLTPAHDPALALRARFNLPDGPILLFFGRLHPKKQPELLIDAFARVLDESKLDSRPSLVLVGPADAAYQESLAARARELGVEDATTFAGPLVGADRVAALQSADLFCLPSQQENFGLAVAEAIAAGTPVLISDQVNIFKEIAAAGVGWATPPALDPYAERLCALCKQPDSIAEASHRCVGFARDTYDWSAIAAHWIDHYKRILTA